MSHHAIEHQRGQILVLFALALVAIVAMVGLVLDGGGAFAQRRLEQNAADVAALAAANDLIVNAGNATWEATARSIASQNGFENGVNGTVVSVTCVNCPGTGPNQRWDDAVDGVQVTVDITAPHANNFAGVVGMPTWAVSTTATAKTGWQNTAYGPGPLIVSINAFDPVTKLPRVCTSEANRCDLIHPVSDVPIEPTDFTWTNFGYTTECVDTGGVQDSFIQNYMDGQADFSITLEFGCYIAQHNNGEFDNIVRRIGGLVPVTFPVPIVDPAGKYVGWASFVVTNVNAAGRNSTIGGYFKTGAQNQQLDVKGAGFGASTYGGTYGLKLIN